MRQRLILLTAAVLNKVSGFSTSPTVLRPFRRDLSFSNCGAYILRNSLEDEHEFLTHNLKIPLLRSNTFLSLPSSHLPDELATLNVYSIPLETALDQSILQYATEHTESYVGHVVDAAAKVGTVGCVSQALRNNAESLVCKGAFRFVVKQVLQEIPFPVVLVDELVDEDISDSESSDATESAILLLSLLDEYCQQELETAGEVSPLEQAILEETGNAIMPIVIQQLAMEKAAVLQVFRAFYFDSGRFSLSQILYATALLAAEIADFSAKQRQELLEMTNGMDRLSYTREIVDEKVGMARARKIAEQITAATDEAAKNLKIGTPQLPPWAKSIRKGTEVEYYWNEEYGWCRGEVIEDPLRIVDEIVLTVRFIDDGETHRLPFSAEEKIRWRPPSRLDE